jgi:L-serine deaminase
MGFERPNDEMAFLPRRDLNQAEIGVASAMGAAFLA